MRRIFYNSPVAWALLGIFKKYSTLMFFGFICTKYKKERGVSARHVNHEAIHVEQYMEVTAMSMILALVLMITLGWGAWLTIAALTAYYIIYFVENAISMVHNFCAKGRKSIADAAGRAYRNSMFEMEAYENESNLEYISNRKPFAWIKHFGRI